MKSASPTSNKPVILIAVGLTLVLAAAACAGNAIPVTSIPIPTTVPPLQVSNTPVSVATSALQILPTDTGQVDPTATSTPSSGQVSFSQNVLPIFQANCTGCHGSDRQASGIDLSSYNGVLAAEGRGVIVPGDAANSPLVQAVAGGFMPRGGTPLSAQDIQTISTWINAGAPNN